MSRDYQSWGRYPAVEQNAIALNWRHNPLPSAPLQHSVLPYGNGRSYGDCCLNAQGSVIDTQALKHLISFDKKQGILRCEAGITLQKILEVVVTHDWFLAVTPGTQFVTLGGAIANDVHGKNHQHSGTFCRHLRCFELLRSNGERLLCSATENSELFHATIAGLGLTGVIIWAEIQLKPINNAFINHQTIRFSNLEAFIQLSQESDQDYEYTVAWLDCLAQGDKLGRGHFIRGNHAPHKDNNADISAPSKTVSVPFNAPSFAMHPWVMKTFNQLYYHQQPIHSPKKLGHYQPFFYPLDAIQHWNRLYGKPGFLQYQCVVPYENGNLEPIKQLLKLISAQGQGSFLAVLKLFGNIESPGMLSFPRPGLTLALDFPNRGEPLLKLFAQLDQLVMQYQGAIYPAKDAAMSAQSYQQFYPQWQTFSEYIDPKFSSSFWRRVTGTL